MRNIKAKEQYVSFRDPKLILLDDKSAPFMWQELPFVFPDYNCYIDVQFDLGKSVAMTDDKR